jgi:rsbT antagonist protein RsbS
MHVTQGCLVVPVQGELYDEFVLQIQNDILEKIKETHIKGVILDLSGVRIVDSFIGQAISDTARMASFLGAAMVITGFRPDVVVSLIDLGIELKDIHTATTLEEGFKKLRCLTPLDGIEEFSEDEDSEEAGDESLEKPGLQEEEPCEASGEGIGEKLED